MSQEKISYKNFLRRARDLHPVYDYSLVDPSLRSEDKIKIICEKHGEFEIQARSMYKKGRVKIPCPSCRKQSVVDTFIEKANEIHGNKFSYHEVTIHNYKNSRTRVPIYCNEGNHFFYQTPKSHIHKKHGCNICSLSKISSYHQKLIDCLSESNIQMSVNNRSVLGNDMELDIFLPEHDIGIEINGVYFHSKKKKEYHSNKFKRCLERNIKLLQFWDTDLDDITSFNLRKFITNKDEIDVKYFSINPIRKKEFEYFTAKNKLGFVIELDNCDKRYFVVKSDKVELFCFSLSKYNMIDHIYINPNKKLSSSSLESIFSRMREKFGSMTYRQSKEAILLDLTNLPTVNLEKDNSHKTYFTDYRNIVRSKTEKYHNTVFTCGEYIWRI